MEYHPSDALWIVEDLHRQGCWASGATPGDALVALGVAQNDYDEFFPPETTPARTPSEGAE
jgi:hypothetical protein